MTLVSQPLVSPLMVVGPCPLCVPQLLYVSRMGVVLPQGCWAKWNVYHFTFLESFPLHKKKKWRLLGMNFIPSTYLSQHLHYCHRTNHQSKSCLSSQASHPFIGSLPYLLWGLHQLLSLSHCTRSEGKGITCIVHCYSSSVSLWYLADSSKCSANVAWLKVFNLCHQAHVYDSSSHRFHFSFPSYPVKIVLVSILLAWSHSVLSLKNSSVCFISDLTVQPPL